MIVDLSHRALLCVSGTDAKEFLHNQLSNDIANIPEKTIQLNAYCTHQGKVIALFRVFKIGERYYLDFPANLLDKVQQRLKMFVLNSAVIITDVSCEFKLFGFIDKTPNNDILGTIIAYTGNQSLLLVTSNDLPNFDLADLSFWQWENIRKMLPDIELTTSEKFIPQMLNLDIDEMGVNFKKGCYPGQEVVARLHYLGKAKRRLAIFKSTETIKVADELQIQASQSFKASGIVVLVAKVAEFFYCLATIEVVLINEDIYVNDIKLERFNNE